MPKDDNIENAIKLLGCGKQGSLTPVNFSNLRFSRFLSGKDSGRAGRLGG